MKKLPKKTKEINFDGKYIQLVLDEEKQITVRKYDKERHCLSKGDRFLGRFLTQPLHTVIKLEALEHTEIIPLIGLTAAIAQDDGYETVQELESVLREYYPDLDNKTPMAIIRFQLVRKNDES